jgi:hypothetical protein
VDREGRPYEGTHIIKALRSASRWASNWVDNWETRYENSTNSNNKNNNNNSNNNNNNSGGNSEGFEQPLVCGLGRSTPRGHSHSKGTEVDVERGEGRIYVCTIDVQ